MSVLTEREVQVLELVSEGLTNLEIARRLSLSPLTVKEHMSRISTKVGTEGRAGLVGWAFRNGYLR